MIRRTLSAFACTAALFACSPAPASAPEAPAAPAAADYTIKPEEKTALIDGLITICKTEAWSELPPAAGGQQVAVGATAAPASKPAPAPAPKPAIIHTPKASVPIAAPKPEPVDEAPAPVDPITAAITALQAAIAAKPAPVAADIGLSVDEVRYVVRKEIASVFRTIAEVLEAQTK